MEPRDWASGWCNFSRWGQSRAVGRRRGRRRIPAANADPAASAIRGRAPIRPSAGPGAGAKGAAALGDGGAGTGLLTSDEAVAHPVAPALAEGDGGDGRDAVADGAAAFPSSTADSDRDGVPDALDFCPGTPAGTTVDSVGCGAQERAALSMVTLTLDPHAQLPIVFQAPAADVQYTATGAVVGGSLLLETPLGEVPMFGAHVTFGYAPGTSDIVTVAGTVQVPLPHDGRFGKFSISTPALAQIGYGPGSGVTQEAGEETPIQATTKYLYFDTTGGFGVKYGSTMSIDGPGGSQRIFLDPSDPYLFAEGQVTGIPKSECCPRLRHLRPRQPRLRAQVPARHAEGDHQQGAAFQRGPPPDGARAARRPSARD